ncbi:hypothetical protein [Aromatoleum evansii]|uniref:hypothetical protein n=1 Tax=Aromatoleum evansii TaxID=59406 RepID=UPI00145EDB61|nr:hypothetical protein [Aromatoleum evansii]NMG29945.1 hypothetical protein [Aromatoleum evansii]
MEDDAKVTYSAATPRSAAHRSVRMDVDARCIRQDLALTDEWKGNETSPSIRRTECHPNNHPTDAITL